MSSEKESKSLIKSHSEPWQSSNGKLLPDAEIKSISKHWDLKTWENYLATIIDVKRSESFINHKHLESTEIANSSDSHSPCASPTHNLELLPSAMTLLKPRQQQIISLIFWEGKSLRQISKILNISLAVVRRTRDRALRDLKKTLKANGAQLPYIGANNNFLKKGEKDESTI